MDKPREPLPTRVQETPPLPPAYHDALDAGLDALRLTLTPNAKTAIEVQARLLLVWTTAINLTAIREPAAVALAHVVDSLSGLSVLLDRGIDRFLDIGSGGGYPGLPLAAALPAQRALLLEPVRKKTAFLAAAVAAAGLDASVEAVPVRAEALAADARHRSRWPAVLARAVGGLGELVELAFPLLEPGGCLVAWKRGEFELEIQAAERAMAAMGGGRLDVLRVAVPGLERHCLVIATAKGRVPGAYPRDPAARKRRPW